MFTSRKKMNAVELEFLNMLYDYCLNPYLTERERKIGLMAKQDLEKGRYSVAVLNQVVSSLQQEAIMHHLTADASIFYKKLNPIMDKLVPIGTNRGSMMINRSYLD